MHFKNIRCTIIKDGTVSVAYVEDKKKVLVSLNKAIFSRHISVEHSFPNHLLIFATFIKTSGLVAYDVKASTYFDLGYFSKENQQRFN